MDQTNREYKKALKCLQTYGLSTEPRKMKIKELIAYSMYLDPKHKIITIPGFETNVDYAKKELEWYFSATNKIDFDPVIEKTWKKFSDDGYTVNSAYGHRIFGKHTDFPNQWEWIKNKLKEDPYSRQCICNLNYPKDKSSATKDFVCTVYFQVFIRENKLIWITNMRSQDIFYGTRNDVFCFMSMQERLANELGVEVGEYIHFCGSLHIYEKHFDKLDNLFKPYKNVEVVW